MTTAHEQLVEALERIEALVKPNPVWPVSADSLLNTARCIAHAALDRDRAEPNVDALAELEALKAEREEHRQHAQDCKKRNKQLVEALLPLSHLWHDSLLRRLGGEEAPIFGLNERIITKGDILRARKALAGTEPEEYCPCYQLAPASRRAMRKLARAIVKGGGTA